MRKIWTLLAIGVLTTVIVGCAPRQQDKQIDAMTNLAQILVEANNLTQQFQRGEINEEQMTKLTLELEDKYAELTQNGIMTWNKEWEDMQKDLDEKFEGMRESIEAIQQICDIPEWVGKLWITKPQWLNLEKEKCAYTSADVEWFDSLTMTYQGTYEAAMQQAGIIAEKAKVPVSAEFKMAQDALSGLTTEEIWAITSGSMLKWIVYTNYGLLATDMEYLITISVDENGKLTIEVTNYEQMKK